MERSIKGITLNPGLILDAADYKGQHGELIGGDYLNNNAVQSVGSNKELMDTGWFASNTFRDTITIRVVFNSQNVTPNSVCILGKISRRLKGCVEIDRITNIYYAEDPYMNSIAGVSPIHFELNSKQTHYIHFDNMYEYRIQLFTKFIDSTSKIILDYIYFQFNPRGVIVKPHEQGGSLLSNLDHITDTRTLTAVSSEPVLMMESLTASFNLNTPYVVEKYTAEESTFDPGKNSYTNQKKLYGTYDKINSVTVNPTKGTFDKCGQKSIYNASVEYILDPNSVRGVLPKITVHSTSTNYDMQEFNILVLGEYTPQNV